MYEQVEKTTEKKSQLEANGVSQRQNSNAPTSRFVDNRPEAIQMQKLRELAKNSPQNAKLRDLHHLAAANSVAQKKSNVKQGFGFVDNRTEAIAQRKLQEMANNSPQVKRAAQLQAMANNYSTKQRQPTQKKENNTGLPDNLKSGIENLSGYSMDDVKVHYNSAKPAQLQAHAYAQGTDIHLASGQEKHLPHEAWHVVQQKQGRVKPTLQMPKQSGDSATAGKGPSIAINDDAGLEKEADIMGVKALQKVSSNGTVLSFKSIEKNNTPAQLMGVTPQGAKSAMLGNLEKQALANQLLNGNLNVEDYMQGVCYDAVAFVKYLLGGGINHNQLLDIGGQGWLPVFNFMGGNIWVGGNIPAGTAVGFYRLVDNQIFHASISVGGTVVRGINGGLLGAGWANAPRDLSTLAPDPNNNNAFIHDNTSIRVFLSNL